MVRPWNSDIDDKILSCLLWEQVKKVKKKKPVMKHGIAIDVDIATKSYTELYEAAGRPPPETFSSHLKRLVEKLQYLRKYREAKGKREVYGFDKETYLKIYNDSNLSPEEQDRRRLKIKYGLT
jgi:hypothetical protein